MRETLLSIFLVIAGIFSMGGAYFEWGFFFNYKKVKRLVEVLGKKGARIVYFVLGVILVLVGAVSLITGINLSY